MHRHVRGVGDQRAFGAEHRAGKVEAFLDVHRIGGVLQHDAHLLGDRHEQVVEHFQHHGIGFGADRVPALERRDAPEHEMILLGDLRAPAVLDHDRLVRLDDDRGALHRVPGRELVARVHGRVAPLAAGIEAAAMGGRGERAVGFRPNRLGEGAAAADRLDRHRLDHQLLVLVDEAETRFVCRFECGFHFGEAGKLTAPSPRWGEGRGEGGLSRRAQFPLTRPLRGRPLPTGER